MIRATALGYLRHALTGAGVFLVTHGLGGPEQADALASLAEPVLGILTVLGSVGWYAIEKYLEGRFGKAA